MTAMSLPSFAEHKRTYLIAASAAAAFVAWRWYSARGAAPADVVPTGMDTGSVTDTPGGSYGPGHTPSGGDGGAADPAPATNASWAQEAVQLLVDQGWDGAAVQVALGKYLTDQAVTSDEERMIRAAIGVAGFPPQGSHTIHNLPSPAPTPTPTPTLSAPAGLRTVSATTAGFVAGWNAVAGATRYRVVVPSLGYDWQTGSLRHDIPVPAAQRKQRVVVQVFAGDAAGHWSAPGQYWSRTK